ncbi:hypothetical protein QTP86_022480 [Hemibagrus guttatus]|nr:hypothetical protein QTP86_022480 [Hemibagrus guttatus]
MLSFHLRGRLERFTTCTFTFITCGRKRKADSVDGDGVSKKQKKEEEEEKKQLEMKLKGQSQLIWGIKDKLKKYCSVNDMKELLIANSQEVPAGESNILDRLSDCMAFGSLKPCETCQGQLVFKSDAYYCTGDISAWTKCVVKTQTPNRKDWVTPKEFHEIPFLKKFKFKRQDRVFPKEPPASPAAAPASSSAASASASAASSTSSSSFPTELPSEVPAEKPLTGLKVLAVGKLSKNKDELKAVVEELGGKITGTVNKATFCLSSRKEVEKMSKKMEEVRDAGVRVVSEEFLTDIKSSGKALRELISLHGISPWGAEVKLEAQASSAAAKSSGASKSSGRAKEDEGGSKSKTMKLTVKGGAAVDPDSGLEDCAHVLDQNGKIYSATLGLVDIVRGTNSYYKLQLLEDDVQKRYWVFRSWGRVGTSIGGNKLEKFYDKNSAIDNFRSVYEEKTGNCWTSSSFTKYPNKFYPLEIDYGQDEEAVKKLTASSGTKSHLAKPVQELIRMIFDVESMKKAMVEFEIDLQKMPLGKLSKRQIQSAYSLLTEVQQAVSDKASEALILDLSNRFYTLIPHDFGMKKPPLLNNLDYIQAKVQMLDNLLDIEVAYSLLRGGAEDNKKDPIDINYEKLRTKIEVVDKSSEEAQIIQQYVKNTHAETHNTYTLEVEEIFKIEREGEFQRFRPFKDLPNRQLLWHGSRTTNYAGILSQGLRIAPPEAPVTGYMFGKGVYFADMVSKSANYCHTSQADPVGLILLGEVALGNMHELKKASHITKLPKGKHSVKGLGRTAPDPSATVSFKGVDVPLGKGANTNIDDTSLLYNERELSCYCSSAKALVSLREGSLSNTLNEKNILSKSQNTRGRSSYTTMETPTRSSKRSRFSSEEEERSLSSRSPRRSQRVTTVPQKLATVATPDKKASQKIGLRLRNLLKLPKAHKWCIYEWFYSNIDRPLFEGDNDFCLCLNESFPNLKTRKLTRVEWGTIRRLMGKPRRCSSAFFAEERTALKQKRQKMRLLQQRKITDISLCKDLPEEIPLPLVIGTKVTARLRGVQDGLFTGQIDAVDTSAATYRVTFDRSGLGTHTVPDYEVLSNEPPETMPISAFAQKQRPSRYPNFMTPPRGTYPGPTQPVLMDSDPLFSQSPWKNKLTGSDGETLGGFPVKFLVQVTRLSKILMIKKEHIKHLKEMNSEAEKLKSYSMPVEFDFQRRYATTVLDLEQLNKDLNKVLHEVQQFCYELAPDQGMQPADQPSELRRRCDDEAQEMVRLSNALPDGEQRVQSPGLTQLISRLTALLLQIRCLAEGGDLNSFEFKSLTDSLNDIKNSIDNSNLSCFQDNVEIHVAHIQSGLSQLGNLHAFSINNTNRT